MRKVLPSGDLAFVSHIPYNLASGGGLYSRAIVDLLRSVWTAGSVHSIGPQTAVNCSRLACIGWAFMSSQPSKAIFAARSGLAKELSRIAIDQYEFVCLNSPDALPLVERVLPGARIILVCHNIESELFKQQVSRLPYLARPLFSNDIRKYSELEDRSFRKASLIIAISDCEVEAIRRKYPAAKVVHIPPVFEDTKRSVTKRSVTRSENGAELRLGFVGRMHWWPNRDAVAWLRHNLTPLPEGREIHLYGVGSEGMADPQMGLIGHGFVEDAEALWNQIDIAICPMRSGGGANIKLVEALARGVPVLTTSFGMRGLGLDLSDRLGLRVLDTAEEWRAFIESNQITELARETPDPSLANHFRAETHAKRLSIALNEASLLP